MMASMEGRSSRRSDGLVSATTVINAMVVFLYWRLFLDDPKSVTRDGQIGELYLEIYLHGVGPLLQWIDALSIHRSYCNLVLAAAWLVGPIALYLTWGETLVQWNSGSPVGSVTTGIPYPFLNNMELPERLTFYGVNIVTALVLLLVFAALAWLIKRFLPAPAMP